MDSNLLLMKLSLDTGLSYPEVTKLSASAPFRYRHYQIKKRSGGMRDIHHPTPELKVIQKWLVRNIILRLPVHNCVYSYREGRGIKQNAEQHLRSKYFLRVDFENFFPSIKYIDILHFLLNSSELDELELEESALNLITKLLCRAPRKEKLNIENMNLSIGAPSSPALSNAILYDLDERFFKLSNANDVIYSRYADDLYFSTSTPDVLDGLYKEIAEMIRNTESPALSINQRKTSYISKKHRVKIAGIKIKSDGGISVGRERKRFIKSQIHKYLSHELKPEEIARVKGLLAFVAGIEPIFIDRLYRKFNENGQETMLNELITWRHD